MCRLEVDQNIVYIEWLSQIVTIFHSNINDVRKKQEEVKRQNDNALNALREEISDANETFKIVKERSSGSKNVLDVERTVLTENADGTLRKTVVKDTVIKVTVRNKKKKQTNSENIEPGKIGCESKIRKAKTVNSVMNHLSGHDKYKKAALLSKVIDNEGKEFAENVIKNSKSLQENSSLNAEQTTSLISGTRTSDLVFRQMRTAFNKTIGFSPIASHKKVEKYRDETMAVSKDDWKIEDKNIYQNKQGKNKDIPRKAPVLMVKDLMQYIQKIAESEIEYLDMSKQLLPLCFDADAGRFVAIFAFLNRNDQNVKIHPFLLFEGSDCRKNMEMTIGEFRNVFEQMDGAKIDINGEEVTIKQYGLFDLCALNCLIGKQNHSATYPCAWTNVTKDHLNSENHSGIPHTSNNCKNIIF